MTADQLLTAGLTVAATLAFLGGLGCYSLGYRRGAATKPPQTPAPPVPAPAVVGAGIAPPRVVQQARRPVPDVNKHVLDQRLWKAPERDGRRWQAGVVHTTAVPAVDLPAVERTS